MNKVALYSVLLVAGLVGSQLLPAVIGDRYESVTLMIHLLTMTGLAFIMIHVGFEFDIDKKNPRQYGWDYVVAATAATFPWVLCCLYFVLVMIPADAWGQWTVWKESLLASRFAAPTSAGVLFSMLAAAGLGATWLFHKARILAIFDDLDTILLLIPLQAAIVGFRWQLLAILLVMISFLWVAWRFLHAIRLPVTWPWVIGYSVILVAASESIYRGSRVVDPSFPVHLEILLPAFVLGSVLVRPKVPASATTQENGAHADVLETRSEQRVATIVSAIFMCCVGLSFPVFAGGMIASATSSPALNGLAAFGEKLDWTTIGLHVLAITILSNVGKMFATFCYRKEASLRERLALGIGLWPRGEVGAGVLVISLSYGIGGPIVVVAILSLALNLILTGFFIFLIRQLLTGSPSITKASGVSRLQGPSGSSVRTAMEGTTASGLR